MKVERLETFEEAGEEQFYVMKGGDVPWGDYGHILTHGMYFRGRIQRTGPFIPPITFVSAAALIVTDDMKTHMEQAGFKGISFEAVVKSHIADVAWHTWDLDAPEPPYFPESGEPEDFILDAEHSPEVAEAMGDLWRVIMDDGAVMERYLVEKFQHGKMRSVPEYKYVEGSWNGSDLFTVEVNGYWYASARAKRWFETYFEKWTSFVDGMLH